MSRGRSGDESRRPRAPRRARARAVRCGCCAWDVLLLVGGLAREHSKLHDHRSRRTAMRTRRMDRQRTAVRWSPAVEQPLDLRSLRGPRVAIGRAPLDDVDDDAYAQDLLESPLEVGAQRVAIR